MSTIQKKPSTKKKEAQTYYTSILSRHPSHDILRKNSKLKFPFRSLIRMGSTTEKSSSYAVTLNKANGIMLSSNKWLFKERLFSALNTSTALKIFPVSYRKIFNKNGFISCISSSAQDNIPEKEFPLLAKPIYGSKAKGIVLINTKDEFDKFINEKNCSSYIFEHYFNYAKEYRFHVSRESGCFYPLRKMLLAEASERFYKNSTNSYWVLETNEEFDKPSCFKDIEESCVQVLKVLGLDFGAFDILVTGNSKKESYKILEVNSAPSFTEHTADKYIEEFKKLIESKISAINNVFSDNSAKPIPIEEIKNDWIQ